MFCLLGVLCAHVFGGNSKVCRRCAVFRGLVSGFNNPNHSRSSGLVLLERGFRQLLV